MPETAGGRPTTALYLGTAAGPHGKWRTLAAATGVGAAVVSGVAADPVTGGLVAALGTGPATSAGPGATGWTEGVLGVDGGGHPDTFTPAGAGSAAADPTGVWNG